MLAESCNLKPEEGINAYITAMPGFDLVELRGREAHCTPVAAWAVLRYKEVVSLAPIVPGAMCPTSAGAAVRLPDGRVVDNRSGSDAIYDNIAAWLAAQKVSGFV